MDWSLLKAHVSHPLLRSDLLYGGYIPVSTVFLALAGKYILMVCTPVLLHRDRERSFTKAMEL